ncbi:hypothetical protein [Zoogloea sp.]|uniref:hypothetical protein n=1 Tax=Zoogloea sp. TaxID=49181 RepID=UPI0035AFC620
MLQAGARYIAAETLLEGLAEVRWKEVDEGWVRYDPSAGETLLLAPLTRFVLERLFQPGDGLSADDLVAAVLNEEPDTAPDACRPFVAVALEALLGARLIRPQSSPPLENP